MKQTLFSTLILSTCAWAIPAFANYPAANFEFPVDSMRVQVRSSDGLPIEGFLISAVIDGSEYYSDYSMVEICIKSGHWFWQCKTHWNHYPDFWYSNIQVSDQQGAVTFPATMVRPTRAVEHWSPKLRVLDVGIPFIYSSAITPATQYRCVEGFRFEGDFDCSQAEGKDAIQRLAKMGATCRFNGTLEEYRKRVEAGLQQCKTCLEDNEDRYRSPWDKNTPVICKK